MAATGSPTPIPRDPAALAREQAEAIISDAEARAAAVRRDADRRARQVVGEGVRVARERLARAEDEERQVHHRVVEAQRQLQGILERILRDADTVIDLTGPEARLGLVSTARRRAASRARMTGSDTPPLVVGTARDRTNHDPATHAELVRRAVVQAAEGGRRSGRHDR